MWVFGLLDLVDVDGDAVPEVRRVWPGTGGPIHHRSTGDPTSSGKL